MLSERNQTACDLLRLAFSLSVIPLGFIQGVAPMKLVSFYCRVVFHGKDMAQVNRSFTCWRAQPCSDGQFPCMLLPNGSEITHFFRRVAPDFYNNVSLTIRSAVRIPISQWYLLLRETQPAQVQMRLFRWRFPYPQPSLLAPSEKGVPQAGGSGPSRPEPQRCAECSFQELHPLESRRS